MTVTAIVDDDHHGLVPDSFPLLLTAPPAYRLLLSSLSSYRHSINLFLVFAYPTTTFFTPDAMQFVLVNKPIRSGRLPFHCSIFPPSPFPLAKFSLKIVILPSPPSITFISTSFHEQKRCTKSTFIFSSQSSTPHTRNASKHPLRGLSMYLFPVVVFISHKQKKGYRVCVGEVEEKGVAI